MALQEQSANVTPKSEKPSRKNEEKVNYKFFVIKCLPKTPFLDFSLSDYQNCDARRREEVQKKRNCPTGSTTTAVSTCANSESHLRVDDEKQEP